MSSLTSIAIKNGYPATDLARSLLSHLQQDIASYKRYRQSSSVIFAQSNVVYEAILSLFQEIETKPEPSWSVFEKSAKGVTELEAFLLDLLLEGHDLPATVQKDSSIQTCMTFIGTWEEHHKKVLTVTGSLEASVRRSTILDDAHCETLKKAVVKAQRADDVGTLKELATEMKNNALSDADLSLEESDQTKYVTEVRTTVEGFSASVEGLQELYPEDTTGKIVASTMLLYVPFIVSQFKDRDAKVDEHIKSANLWKAAKDFALYIQGFLRETASPDISKLTGKYDDFKKLIEEVIAIGPWTAEIAALMKKIHGIRRPFYGRSFALLKMWFVINGKDALKNENGLKERRDIKQALKLTEKAFVQAAKLVPSFDEKINISAVSTAYKTAHDALAPIVNKYADGDVAELNSVYTDAEKTDNDHLDRFRKKITSGFLAQLTT